MAEARSRTITFKEPADYEECLIRLDELINAIQDIQADLSNKNRTDNEDKRLSEYAFQDWKQKALKALRYKEREHRFLKGWKRSYLDDKNGLAEADGKLALAKNMYDVARKACSILGWEEVDTETRDAIDEAQVTLRAYGVDV